jgi:putative massive surface protein mspD
MRYLILNIKSHSLNKDPLETYYPQWSAAIKNSHPEAVISKDSDGKYYVEGMTKNRVAVIYENPHLVRLVNATTNLHVDF